MQMWRMAWLQPCLMLATMEMAVMWMWSRGRTQWKCPPWLHQSGRSKPIDHAATRQRPSWRPRSESSVCWWSSSSFSFSAGCLCTVSTPGGLLMTAPPPVLSQERLLLSSTCWATPPPASTPSSTASWTPASARLCSPPSLAAALRAVTAAAAVGCATSRKTLWQRGPPCQSSVTLRSAPWETAERCEHNPEGTVTTATQHPTTFVSGQHCAHWDSNVKRWKGPFIVAVKQLRL